MKEVKIIVGLGYGDEGKGTMTDFLCRHHNATLVVRYNGGAQAAHNVVTDEGVHHTFSQFGSGSFIPGVKTLLSKYMLWNPLALADETSVLAAKLGEHPLDRHFIDCRAPVITPFHVATNQLKEWHRGGGRHGSCGMGIGETGFDLMYFPDEVIRAGDLKDEAKLVALLARIQVRKQEELKKAGVVMAEMPEQLAHMVTVIIDPDQPAKIAAAFAALVSNYNILEVREVNNLVRNSNSVFEGAQGMLLDEWHGFHPYTTWSTLTAANALDILAEANFAGKKEVVGVLRAYGTRHGAGPFVTENPGMRNIFPGEHNGRNAWQGTFRVGAFDAVALRYAVECMKKTASVDVLAVTHLDVFDRGEEVPLCESYADGDKRIDNLEPNFNRDLVYQEALTNLIMKVTPNYTGMFRKGEDVIRFVEENVGAPVRYTSSGMMPKDKKVL